MPQVTLGLLLSGVVFLESNFYFLLKQFFSQNTFTFTQVVLRAITFTFTQVPKKLLVSTWRLGPSCLRLKTLVGISHPFFNK